LYGYNLWIIFYNYHLRIINSKIFDYGPSACGLKHQKTSMNSPKFQKLLNLQSKVEFLYKTMWSYKGKIEKNSQILFL